ncbi:MAG: carboxypeptidase regulatory-like domain-containing protein [Nitrospiraceae bacterium]|nr:MAG: carboxypeptidase regulatory-like domain-containing protein [Nitrospiraceae bacterium]
MKHLLLVMSFVLFATFTTAASAYETVDVKNGATIKGVVKVKGSVPSDESIAIDKNQEICGTAQNMNTYMVYDSRMKNAVVFIDNPQQGKPLPKDSVVSLNIRRCRVEPLVSVGFVGGKFVFKNEDNILHTLQLKLWLEYQRLVSSRPLKDGATIYNIAFPTQDKQIEKPIKEYYRYHTDTGFIRVTSNSDPWIRGFVYIFDHPYAAVTDGRGEFVLDNLPPGEYTLTAWHEDAGIQKKNIKVTPSGTMEIEIEFGPQGEK